MSVDAERAERASELRLAAESIEALASRLAELLGVERRPGPEEPPKMISAAEVSARWGVARRWVYNHAAELGACRLGSGPRPRLRFDPGVVAERLGAPARGPARPDGRRLTAIAGIPHSDSLSARSRAIVGESQKDAAGGRANAPGPAPKEVLRRASKPSPAGLAPPPPPAGTRGGGP